MGTIVCAVDDSPEAAEALRVAARLSAETGLRLVVVHVESTVGAGPDIRRSAEARGRQVLDRLLAAQGLNGSVDKRIELGNPANEVARVAAEEAANVVLLGSGSRRRWCRRRSSSLASEVTATAPCPVAVVPPAARQ